MKQPLVLPHAPTITNNKNYGYFAKSNKVMWTLVFATLSVSIVAIMMRGAAVEWLLAALSMTLIVLSYIFPRLAASQLHIERTVSSHVIDQTPLMLITSVKRRWRIPAVWFATIEELNNESEIEAPYFTLKQMYTPLLQEKMSQAYALKQLGRGQYKSETVTVLIGDLLGLTCIRKTFKQPISFVVLPEILKEERDTFLDRRVPSRQRQTLTSSTELLGTNQAKITVERSVHGEHQLKPYSEGDSVHKIYYHALSRGMGVHVLDEGEAIISIKSVVFIDQYMPPMSEEATTAFFNTLIGWTLDFTERQIKSTPVLIVTDNWCYECYEPFQLEELRRLLAQIKPDVQYAIDERLHSLAKIIPADCQLTVYTTDWKNSDGWTELAQIAWHKKVAVTLQLLTEHRIMTFAMREQQKELEQSDLELLWRVSNYSKQEEDLWREGSEQYA